MFSVPSAGYLLNKLRVIGEGKKLLQLQTTIIACEGSFDIFGIRIRGLLPHSESKKVIYPFLGPWMIIGGSTCHLDFLFGQ